MEEEKKEALENVKGQLENGYIDITDTYPDHAEFTIVKAAVEQFEKNEDMKQKIRNKIKEIKENAAKQGLFIDKEIMNQVEAKIQVLEEILGE